MSEHPPYPVGLRLAGRRVVVVGGGSVAQRRVPTLIATGADVVVVSPEVTPAIEGLASEITLVLRPFETGDLNAPGGISDYAARYGGVMYDMVKDVRYQPMRPDLVERVEAEQRKVMPQARHAEREAWRDRRLMALIAHKRAMAGKERA